MAVDALPADFFCLQFVSQLSGSFPCHFAGWSNYISLYQIKSDTFVPCATCLPAKDESGHTRDLLLAAAKGWQPVTGRKQQIALGQRAGKATEMWPSGMTAKPGLWHRLLNLKLGNQKLMCSTWFQWELQSRVHFKTGYVYGWKIISFNISCFNLSSIKYTWAAHAPRYSTRLLLQLMKRKEHLEKCNSSFAVKDFYHMWFSLWGYLSLKRPQSQHRILTIWRT